MGLPGVSIAIDVPRACGVGGRTTPEECPAVGSSSSLSQLYTATDGWSSILGQESISTEDRLGIGSITKCFVAVVILQLVEEGRVDLHKTAVDYDPSLERVPNASLATLSQLLSHQSGVPSFEFNRAWMRQTRGVVCAHTVFTPHQSLDYTVHMKATNKPGEAFAYSNTNYTLLGMVVEAVTGNPATLEIRKRILEPLHMTSAYMETHERPPPSPSSDGYPLCPHHHYMTPTFVESAGVSPEFCATMASPYIFDTSVANLSAEWVAGGMVMTARDLLAFGKALRDGTLLGPAMQTLLLTYQPPKYPNRTPVDEYGNRDTERSVHSSWIYCQGVAWFTLQDGTMAYGNLGDTLGFRSQLMWMDDGIVVAAMTNVGTMHTGLDPSPFDTWFDHVLMPKARALKTKT